MRSMAAAQVELALGGKHTPVLSEVPPLTVGTHLCICQLTLAVVHIQPVHQLIVSLPCRLACLFVQQGAEPVLLQAGLVRAWRWVGG